MNLNTRKTFGNRSIWLSLLILHTVFSRPIILVNKNICFLEYLELAYNGNMPQRYSRPRPTLKELGQLKCDRHIGPPMVAYTVGMQMVRNTDNHDNILYRTRVTKKKLS